VADYNDNTPYVIGMEWAPIRDASFEPDRATERGYRFNNTSPASIVAGRFFVNTPPAGSVDGQVPFMNVYQAGQENNIGPVRQVTIPCNAISVTGTAPTIFGGGTNVEAVANPGDRRWIILPNVADTRVWFFFNTNAYVGSGLELHNKRILKVEFLYTAFGGLDDISAENSQMSMGVHLSSGGERVTYWDGPLIGPYFGHDVDEIQSIDMGEINPYWSTSHRADDFAERQPFTASNMARLEQSSANRIGVLLTADLLPGANPQIGISYVGLRVTYTDETRLAYGGKYVGYLALLATSQTSYDPGGNTVTLRAANTLNTPPFTLPTGEIIVTMHDASPAGAVLGYTRPKIQALQQLRPAGDVDGVIIERVQLPDGVPPDQVTPALTTSQSDILPQLVLDLAAGPDADAHGYGTIHPVLIYGTKEYAAQTVNPYIGMANVPYGYSWVRFYARHSAETVASLSVYGHNTTLPPIASIDVPAFDELDELVNGWKEVTLPLEAVSMAVTGTDVYFMSFAATAAQRWEILATRAPSASGSGWPNSINPATNNLNGLTFGGTNARFIQYYTSSTGSATSQTYLDGDIPVMFSVASPAVTGLTVEEQIQSLYVIDDGCPAVQPECVPGGLRYAYVSWDPMIPLIAEDLFERSVVAGLGTATSGQTWTLDGGSASQYSVANGIATLAVTGTATVPQTYRPYLSTVTGDLEAYVDVRVVGTPSLAAFRSGLMLHRSAATTYYAIFIERRVNGTTFLRVWQVNNGVADTTVAIQQLFDVANTEWLRLRVREQDDVLYARAWQRDGGVQPSDWQVVIQPNTPLTGTGALGLYGAIESTNSSSASVAMDWDNLRVETIGSDAIQDIELQRQDEYTDWQTIMKTTDVNVSSFNDYEARVGVASEYRIRTHGPLDFEGPWSDVVTLTLTAPGITGGGSDGVLMFTSNEQQGGASNLAYVMNWTGTPEDNFEFLESGDVQFRQVYGRDFQVALRPTERGGVQFQRTLLVQQAAVATDRLMQPFDGIRDLGWANLNYVCVRDETGDRWFAAVQVPQGAVRRGRGRVHLVNITVTEVTDTPTEVDPSA
jgi:hypothetical protein